MGDKPSSVEKRFDLDAAKSGWGVTIRMLLLNFLKPAAIAWLIAAEELLRH